MDFDSGNPCVFTLHNFWTQKVEITIVQKDKNAWLLKFNDSCGGTSK